MKNFVLSLTLFRIFSGPLIFFLIFIFDARFIALFIFILASITDYLDGKLARTFNVESPIGAVLDPIADKILVLFALITIVLATNDVFVGVISAFILAREFWVSALREFAANSSSSLSIKVTFQAKIKTTIQLLSIIMFFLGLTINNALIIFTAKFTLFLALLITFKTALDYSNNLFSNKGVK